EQEALGAGFVPDLPELRDRLLGDGLVLDVPLLADRAQSTHLRGERLLRPAAQRARTPRAAARHRHDQGVRLAGLRHPRGDADGARVACRLRVPAGRSGAHVSTPEQGGVRLGRRVPALGRGGVTDMAALLPPEFSDLEPFASDWCLASEPERYAKRLASTM